MNRRSFLTSVAGVGLSIFAGLHVYRLLFPHGYFLLAMELRRYYDPAFLLSPILHDPDKLIVSLARKGIITESGKIDPDAIRRNAEFDRQIAFSGFYYTESEYELYSLAYFLTHRFKDF